MKAAGEPDWAAIRSFEEGIVDKNIKGLTGLVKARGIEIVQGEATISAGPSARVADRMLRAPNVVVATGSRPRLLPGVDVTERIITSDQALRLDRLPASAIVIGAGAVGLEFASMYRSFGAEVTVLEALPRLAPLEDEEVSKEIARAYRKRGISTTAGAKVQEVKDTGDGVEVSYEAKATAEILAAEICLIATGREPVTEGLGLEELGISMHEKGYVNVDENLRTNVDGVWAIGDVAATPLQLAHVSFDEGYAVAERIAGEDVPPIDYSLVPKVTYCTPEIASVGLTEGQAKEQAEERGAEIETKKLDFRAIGKANIVGEGGFVKVVAEAGGGPTLGVHMIGPHVTDLIAEAVLITAWEATADDVARFHHAHPTLSEGVGEAFLALAGKPLHSP